MIDVAQHHQMTAVRSAIRPTSPLAETRLFASGYLSIEDRLALEDAILPPRTIRHNLDLVREGARTDCVYIVIGGWACRHTATRTGGRHVSTLLLPGDVGNLDSLLFDRLDYSVRTITEATIVALPRNRALALAAEHRGIARTFTWLAMIDNMILSKWSLSLARRSAMERLAHLLCELSVRLRAESDDTIIIPFPLTQEQIADALGLTSVHVNRTMQQLRSDGLIVTANRTVTLPDVARLRRLCDFDPHYLSIAPPSGR